MEGDWRKSRNSLSKINAHLLETGLYSDMTFRVGPKQHKFNGHKCVVMGRSEVFAVMLQERWNSDSKDGENRSLIDIPYANIQYFKLFLEFLYTDGFASKISVEDYLELLSLAHLYQVHSLVANICAALTSKINDEYCVQIYQETRVYKDHGIAVSKTAFNYISSKIKKILSTPAFLSLDEEGLCELLRSDKLAIEESELFDAVLKWSKHVESMNSHVEEPNPESDSTVITIEGPETEVHPTDSKLNAKESNSENSIDSNSTITKKSPKDILDSVISYIRFPLMGSERFSEVVVPAKVLKDQDVIDNFMYFNGRPVKGFRFSTTPRLTEKPRVLTTATQRNRRERNYVDEDYEEFERRYSFGFERRGYRTTSWSDDE